MGIGERIKQLRGNLLQDDFANKVGVHKNTVGRWERGERKPDTDDLNKILQAYPDINPTWLLTGEGGMKKEEMPINLMVADVLGKFHISGKDVNGETFEIRSTEIDRSLLETAIETVEELILKSGSTLDIKKKADLIGDVYEKLCAVFIKAKKL